jgi:hypothetical protein
MKAIIISLMLLGVNPQSQQVPPIVAIMPKELEVPKLKKVVKKGNNIHPFAKFF